MQNLARLLSVFIVLPMLFGCGDEVPNKPTTNTIVTERPPAPRPIIKSSTGLTLENMDLTIAPGEDFYRYANGQWLDNYQLPDGYTSFGTLTEIYERAAQDVADLTIEASRITTQKGSPHQQIGDTYRAYLDTGAIEKRAIAALALQLAVYDEIKSHDDVAIAMARPELPSLRVFGFSVDVDEQRPSRYIAYIEPSGIGLPSRDFYLDPGLLPIKSAYQSMLAKWLIALDKENAMDRAAAIVELETKIAITHRTARFTKIRELNYNLYTTEELLVLSTELPWRTIFKKLGVSEQTEWVIRDPEGLAKISALFTETPINTWKDYLTLHSLNRFADILPYSISAPFATFHRDAAIEPHTSLPRRQRALAEINHLMNTNISRLYVSRRFSSAAKSDVTTIVELLRQAFDARLIASNWMAPTTKAQARSKLKRFSAKIGYPDQWPDTNPAEILPDDPVGNRTRALLRAHQISVERLRRPNIDADWPLAPHSVNAFYSHTRNEIVFPAAILQPPFYSPDADAAINFGAIGAVIGHEMSHAFDENGQMTNADGFPSHWWSQSDRAAFVRQTATLHATMNSMPDSPTIDSALTMSETNADIIGLLIAYDAYRAFTKNKKPPIIDGLTGDQRFFIAWAQIMKRSYRPDELQRRLITDPHLPAALRTNAVLRHIDAWYTAFDINEQDLLYLSPEKRVNIW